MFLYRSLYQMIRVMTAYMKVCLYIISILFLSWTIDNSIGETSSKKRLYLSLMKPGRIAYWLAINNNFVKTTVHYFLFIVFPVLYFSLQSHHNIDLPCFYLCLVMKYQFNTKIIISSWRLAGLLFFFHSSFWFQFLPS